MKNLHPLTVIIIGLILVSIGFHFLQSAEIDRLKKQLQNQKNRPLIIDMNPALKLDIKPTPNRSI